MSGKCRSVFNEIDLERGRSEVGDEVQHGRRSLDVSIRAERAYYENLAVNVMMASRVRWTYLTLDHLAPRSGHV
jgi:hypothetical protein